MTKGSAISILYVLAGELIALAFNVKMRTICIHSAHLPGGHRSGLYWSVNYASLQLCRPCSTLMVKATKKIIKKFTKATHGHPLFTKILFENFTKFTQGNGITRSKLYTKWKSDMTSWFEVWRKILTLRSQFWRKKIILNVNRLTCKVSTTSTSPTPFPRAATTRCTWKIYRTLVWDTAAA